METLDPHTSNTLSTPSDVHAVGFTLVSQPITAIKSSDLTNLFSLEIVLQRVYITIIEVEIFPNNQGR